MGLAKVWNDNQYEHVEKYKGREIVIPSYEFIEMELEDAMDFKSQFTAPRATPGGGFDKRSYKMIRVEPIPDKDPVAEKTTITCQACGEEVKDQTELQEHIVADHMDMLVEDDAKKDLEKQGAKRGKSRGNR